MNIVSTTQKKWKKEKSVCEQKATNSVIIDLLSCANLAKPLVWSRYKIVIRSLLSFYITGLIFIWRFELWEVKRQWKAWKCSCEKSAEVCSEEFTAIKDKDFADLVFAAWI